MNQYQKQDSKGNIWFATYNSGIFKYNPRDKSWKNYVSSLEVTYDKTVHVIFPSEVRYVDLGSPDLIAGKADGAENVIRVKATVRNFPNETNMSVITEDGSFYTFNVKYAAEPLLLNVEMCDFIHDGEKVNRPNNAQEIYLKELGSESPMLVRLIMKSIPTSALGVF